MAPKLTFHRPPTTTLSLILPTNVTQVVSSSPINNPVPCRQDLKVPPSRINAYQFNSEQVKLLITHPLCNAIDAPLLDFTRCNDEFIIKSIFPDCHSDMHQFPIEYRTSIQRIKEYALRLSKAGREKAWSKSSDCLLGSSAAGTKTHDSDTGKVCLFLSKVTLQMGLGEKSSGDLEGGFDRLVREAMRN